MKLVDGFRHLDYYEGLNRLDIPTFVYRSLREDMIVIFKHFQQRDRISRKHTFQLHGTGPKDGVLGILSNFVYFRSARICNGLPKDVVNSKCITTFKNNLDKHWKDVPMKNEYRNTTESDS